MLNDLSEQKKNKQKKNTHLLLVRLRSQVVYTLPAIMWFVKVILMIETFTCLISTF